MGSPRFLPAGLHCRPKRQFDGNCYYLRPLSPAGHHAIVAALQSQDDVSLCPVRPVWYGLSWPVLACSVLFVPSCPPGPFRSKLFSLFGCCPYLFFIPHFFYISPPPSNLYSVESAIVVRPAPPALVVFFLSFVCSLPDPAPSRSSCLPITSSSEPSRQQSTSAFQEHRSTRTTKHRRSHSSHHTMNVLRIFIIIFACLFLLGSALTLFLTILTGATQTSVLRRFYWLETDCSNFSGSPISSTCRWTNYGLCGVEDNKNSNCTHDVAAYPFSPSRNFNSNNNLPSPFVDNANYYYYTSRIGYGFSLVGLAFLVFSWFPFATLLFTQVGFVALQSVFWVLYGLALLFVIIGIALSTSAYAKGRNHFRKAGFTANLGTKAMATAWTTVFLLLFSIPFIVFASREWSLGSLGSKRRGYNVGVNEEANGNHKPGRFSFRNRSKPAYGSSSNGGWFKRKDIPPSNQMVAIPEGQQTSQPFNETSGNPNNVAGTDGTTSANYLSFTPVKEVKAGSVTLENTDADRNLYS